MSNRANIYLLNTVKKILKNGIFLGALTRPDEYLNDLAEYFNESGFCSAVFDGDELVIEGRDWVPILSLRIEQNTLIIVPLEEPRFFQSFMDIICLLYTSDAADE